MKNLICYAGIVISVVIITAVFVICCRESRAAADFVRSYGWEIQPHPIECAEVILPREFDDVYLQYNELQKKIGLDLEAYRGMKAVRYTFSVNNYPSEFKEQVRANVLIVRGEAVGGDISTTSLDGFMHSLGDGLHK